MRVSRTSGPSPSRTTVRPATDSGFSKGLGPTTPLPWSGLPGGHDRFQAGMSFGLAKALPLHGILVYSITHVKYCRKSLCDERHYAAAMVYGVVEPAIFLGFRQIPEVHCRLLDPVDHSLCALGHPQADSISQTQSESAGKRSQIKLHDV